MKILPIELTEKEVQSFEDKCVELEKKYQCSKVHVCVQMKTDGTNERVVSYFKEPSFFDKLALMSKVREDNQYIVANELREIYQLKEDSHPLTYGDSHECEEYKLGVVTKCIEIITMVRDRFKKK